MNVTYIKNNTPDKYITFSRLLDSNLYNNIGTTWEDYLDNKWVKLSRAQIQYHKDYPEASVYEVFNMQADPSIDDFNLDKIINNKIAEVEQYDSSTEINLFYINDMPCWWDKNQRIAIFHRLDIETKLKKKETILWINDFKITTTITKAYNFLYKLEEYAIQCLDNTKSHISNIKQLTDIELINNYNYKIGYPEKINIQL